VLAGAADDLPDGLVSGTPTLLDLMPADGAVVRIAGRIATAGRVPDVAALLGVVDAHRPDTAGQPWATDRLGEADPAAAPLADLAAGVLVLPLSQVGDVAVWCRGEVSRDVRWATDPGRPVVTSRFGHRLTPRGSSAVWRQTVRGRSTPWTAVEHAIARDLWQAVSGLVLRRAAELADLNLSLRASNTELEAFAHVVSHDLKEPLRGIAHAAAFIAEDAGEILDETTTARLDTIGRLAVRMDDLLNAVMRYATLGRADLDRAETDLDTALDDVLDTFGDRITELGAVVRRAGRLPVVVGDRVRLYEVLQNLVGNALKYAAAGRAPVVEVGTAMVVPPDGDVAVLAVYVRDNGIGIDSDHHREIFRMFRRVSADGETAGSGVGLAIAQRIVERHGGQIWLDSAPGVGSTFWFSV
jgi:two-component system, chemotaxis family, sensor kinase Cph1